MAVKLTDATDFKIFLKLNLNNLKGAFSMSLNFDKYTKKANEIVNELSLELGNVSDSDKAGRVLRSVLHALRNILSTEESVQLLSQLPMYIKAVYVDGWKINKKHVRIRHLEDFLEEVCTENEKNNFRDFPNESSVYNAVLAVFNVLRNHVSAGEIDDIKSNMPKELKHLWEDEKVNI